MSSPDNLECRSSINRTSVPRRSLVLSKPFLLLFTSVAICRHSFWAESPQTVSIAVSAFTPPTGPTAFHHSVAPPPTLASASSLQMFRNPSALVFARRAIATRDALRREKRLIETAHVFSDCGFSCGLRERTRNRLRMLSAVANSNQDSFGDSDLPIDKQFLLDDDVSTRIGASISKNGGGTHDSGQPLLVSSKIGPRVTLKRPIKHRKMSTQMAATRAEIGESITIKDLREDTPRTSSKKTQNRQPPSTPMADASEEELLEGLTSRPVENGNWDVRNPLGWSKDFGRRSPEYEAKLKQIAHLRPGDEGYHDVSDLKVEGVTIVRNKEDARIVVEKLMAASPTTFHACDTEVMDIDLSQVGPIGNGYVTCATIYSGKNFDYGLGDGPGTTLFIDNLDDAYGILQEFKEWFEDPNHLKIWHNYGFDRHVMWNEGINCRGFAGDTMHMARLENTARSKSSQGAGYSLEALTAEFGMSRKRPMKEIFGVPRLRKDGTESTIRDLPSVDVLQRDPQFRGNFIQYACYDAESTYNVYRRLAGMLNKKNWFEDKSLYVYYWDNMREFGEVLTDMERRGIRVDAKDYLASVEVQARKDRQDHVNRFRQWAFKKLGADGLALNTASAVQLCTFLFGGSPHPKTGKPTDRERQFKVAFDEIPEDALEAYAKQEALKAKANKKKKESSTSSDMLDQLKAAELKKLCKEEGLKMSGKKSELVERLREHYLRVVSSDPDDFDSMSDAELYESAASRGLSVDEDTSREKMLHELRSDIEYAKELAKEADTPKGYRTVREALEDISRTSETTASVLKDLKEKMNTRPKFMNVTITSVGMPAEKFTAGGAPSVTADVIRTLAGDPHADPPKFGSAFKHMGGGEEGREACEALYSLGAIGSIDTMISSFLTSLQSLADHQQRVHCSLNLNTDTGRLSSRRPNLQNQPALEKDKYKIRKAFQSSPGNSLIVADYGQLELRLLASLTNCKSMIDAFNSGGDFHSRTAVDMFDYIKKEIDDGNALLEWDYSKGEPPKPMVKDIYGSERRKAKTLNFSIAYGKTAHGLSADWGVDLKEAQAMLDKWYNARPEVRNWQAKTKEYANEEGVTRTLMGRYRSIPDAMSRNRGLKNKGERASINTPIQGGAADVAMMAMNKINRSEKLKRLGWILLMQIHDEVILEGPEETAKEAFDEVIECMQNPWVYGLAETAVPLLVDGSYTHKTWYDAK